MLNPSSIVSDVPLLLCTVDSFASKEIKPFLCVERVFKIRTVAAQLMPVNFNQYGLMEVY